ncbi:MAG: hypothetical protein FDZ70_01835 [Actinobacteria bacterium]|nr:MAG: hypothetical protein FDZ70_01835 [Actinomycetota bacterium]
MTRTGTRSGIAAAVLVTLLAGGAAGCAARGSAQTSTRLAPVADQPVGEIAARCAPYESELLDVERIDLVAYRALGQDEPTETAILVTATFAEPGPGASTGWTLYTPDGGDAGGGEATVDETGRTEILCNALSYTPEADDPGPGTYLLSACGQSVYLDLERGLWSETDGGEGEPIGDRIADGTVYQEIWDGQSVVWTVQDR